MKKYLIALIITGIIFMTPIIVGHYLSSEKVSVIHEENNKISVDILSLETKIELTGDISCSEFFNSSLSSEMTRLGEKIAYAEANFGKNNDEVRNMKKYYYALEIRDFLISEKLKKCQDKPISILYFYSNDCAECEKQGYVLTHIRQKYGGVRIYSFDPSIELPELDVLAKKYEIKNALPALVINSKKYEGYQSIGSILEIIPEITATSTVQS